MAIIDDAKKKQAGFMRSFNAATDSPDSIPAARKANPITAPGAVGGLSESIDRLGFRNTAAAIKGSAEDAQAAYQKGGIGPGIGMAARTAITPVMGLADDVMTGVKTAIDPAANALRTFVTGDVADAGQSVQPGVTAPRSPSAPNSAVASSEASYGNEGRTTRSAINATPSPGMQQWNPVGQKPYDISQTSEPGISKITGNGLSSPLYTNLNNANQAVDGLKQPGIAAGLPGYGAQAASQGITSTPFSAVNAGGSVPGIAAGMPEGLARQAKANAVTQQLIDAQPQGGIGILPDQAERDNADMQRMRMNSRIDDLMSGIKYGKRSERSASAAALGALTGADTQRAVEGMRQQGIAAGLDLQRRGQDIGQAAEAAKLGLTLRGQDMESQRNDARLGLDIGRLGIENQRFGLEKSAMQRQQSAQDNLAKAIESGDQNAIARARTMAAAAGVRLDQAPGVRDRFLTLTEQDANGNKVEVAVDPATGKTIRPQSVAPDRPVGTTSRVGDRVAVWDGSKWVEKS